MLLDINSICKRSLPAILLILFAGIIVYSNTFQVPFVLDDQSSITNNPAVKSLDNFYSNISNYKFLQNRFIVFRTFAYNYHFGGLNVFGFHLVNLIIHLVTALLVYVLLRLTFRTPYFNEENKGTGLRRPDSAPLSSTISLLPSAFIPLFVALLFVIHPVQTQAVTYIVQRLTSMATMFYLLSVMLYVKARLFSEQSTVTRVVLREKTKATVIGERVKPWLLIAGSVIAAVLAMKCKEISFTLPFAVILYEVCFFRGPWQRRFFYLLPLLLTLPIIPMTVIGFGETTGDVISGADEQLRVGSSMSRLDYLFTQCRVIVTYLRLLILPVNQNLDYDYPVYNSFFTAPVLLSFLLLISIFVLGMYLFYITRFKSESRSKSQPVLLLISFGILWFFLGLSVESTLIPIKDLVMEHRLYLPFFGAATAFAASIYLVMEKLFHPNSRKMLILCASILILVFGIATFQRNYVWGNSIRLWQDTVSKSPNKARPINNLGKALEDNGRRSEAAEAFSKAIAVDPSYYKAYYNLADLYLVSDQPGTALQLLQTAIRLNPGFTEAYVSAGAALMRSGRFPEMIQFLQQNLHRVEDIAEARFYLGAGYAFVGNKEAALHELEVLSRLDKTYAANLAGMLGLRTNRRSPHGAR